MLTRFHKTLIGLLVVQLVLAVVMLTRGDDTAAAKERPLLAGFDAAKVTRLVVSGNDKSVDLVKRDDAWVVASHFDYPAEASRVTDVLSPLAKMAAAAPIATHASRHKQLRVGDADHERKLQITADGKELTIYIGGPAGSRRTAVRLGGEDRVFAVQGVSAFAAGLEPRQWVDTKYVRVPTEEIAKLTVERDGKRFALSRTAADAEWTVTLDDKPLELAAGESLDKNAIDGIVNAAASIDLSAPADPARDASQPTATLTLERFAKDATAAPVVIDLVADGTSYWVRQRGLDRAVLVDGYRLDGPAKLERDKLVQKAEPSAEAKGSGAAAAGPG